MDYEEHRRRVEERRRQLARELESLFPHPLTLTFEIGCGHGHWLAGHAAERPERRFLGIDVQGARVERARRKARRAGLRNLLFLRAEAGEALALMPPGIAFDEVFLLFPDPWPKKRHWKHRLVQAPFLEALADRCVPGARLRFRTDHEGYYEWARDQARQCLRWTAVPEEAWPFELETVFQKRARAYRSLTLVKRKPN